jgi:predicted enzyme related to lactoylglutathione lyase
VIPRRNDARNISAMANSIPKTIDYVEISTADVSKSRAFFTALLGWSFTDYGPDYTSFEDGRIAGGFFKSEAVSLTSRGATLAVIYTPALEEAKSDALRLGAKITRDIFDFPGGRRFQFTEPGGSEFALWSDR